MSRVMMKQYYLSVAILAAVLTSACVQAWYCDNTIHNGHLPSPVQRYHIVDLGPANLDVKKLSRFEHVISTGPRINNLGQISYNTSEGAFIRDPSFGEYRLQISGAQVQVHDLNNKGESLVTIRRPDNEIEWVLWPRKSLFGLAQTESELNTLKKHIATLDKSSLNFMCCMNDRSAVVGYKEVNDNLLTTEWTSVRGLKPLGECEGFQIYGFTRGINNAGSVIGFFQEQVDSPPFLFNPCKGLSVLRDYRERVNCQGWIDLADLVLTEENVVYGTYVVRNVSEKRGNLNDVGVYFTYRWDPAIDDFVVLDMRNMRITAINSANTLVGSYNGSAAIRRQGGEPVLLSEMEPIESQGWELIEATGINDKEQIVGYGKKQGEIHLFLFEPI